jgi:two-component system chemotaxis response regulator CheB
MRQGPDDQAVHDIVVIGASAGGVAALPALVLALPAMLPAAVLIVLHMGERYRGNFPELLTRNQTLPAGFASDGQRLEHGRVYVAPPRHNMLLRRGYVAVQASAREGFNRPSINALFRSAAEAYGRRVAGVLLTGTMFDGVAGLWEIERRGGAVIIQDPLDAAYAELPRNALHSVRASHCLPLAGIAELLVGLAVNGR